MSDGTGSIRQPQRRSARWLLDGLALALAMLAMQWLLPLTATGADGVAAGFLLLPALVLLAGMFAGHLASAVGLPRLTGFIVIGVLIGPYVLGLVDKEQVQQVKLVNELAIGLIALMAGAEIRLSWLRARLWSIIGVALAKSAAVPTAIIALFLGLSGLFPVLAAAAGMGVPAWSVAAVAGTMAVANSPMVVVSVIKETASRGPVAEMAIGVAVATDVIVILAFTVLVAVIEELMAGGALGVAGLLASGGGVVVWIALSIAVGLVLGLGLAWLSERRIRHLGWLLVGVALMVAVVAPELHLKPLFVLISAGFACENLWPGRTPAGHHRLERALSQVATPVFVAFFTAAGLGLHLGTLIAGWLAVVLLVSVRATVLWVSVSGTAVMLKSEPGVRRWLWAANIPQAGVTLALAEIIGSHFPGWGDQLRDLFVAAVAVHELIGPILLTVALKRSGEATRLGGGGH